MSATRFLAGLRQALERCELDGAQVLIGVSGGADSVALLRGLLQLRESFSLKLHAAHLNHQLRGTESDADAAWVRALCQILAVPVKIGNAGLLERPAAGVEEAARDARHRFLDESAADFDCPFIVTAHTADDQAETVLHHIFRGTGLAGLRGIPEIRATSTGRTLVRPMLAIRREHVEAYLAELGQEFRTDSTNADTALTRNWLRHKLLPDLREQFGPRLDLSLSRLTEQAREIERTLEILATRLLEKALLDAQPLTVRLNSRLFADEPVHLVREVFRVLWQHQQWPRQGMGFAEWQRLADVAFSGGDINLPGNVRARQHPPGLLVLEKSNR